MSNRRSDSFMMKHAVAKTVLAKAIVIALLLLSPFFAISAVPEPIALKLPVTSLKEFKRLTGKRVQLVQDLVVSDLYGAGYGLGNYGQFAVSSKLHFQPTELITAAEILKNPKVLSAKQNDYLLVDDGSAQLYPRYIPFPNKQGFSATNSLRIGDTLKAGSIGTLRRYKQYYIFIPELNLQDKNSLIGLNLQPAKWKPLPEVDERSNLVVASMNLGNYFNGDFNGNFNGKSKRKKGFPTARGAKTYQGFQLQTAKIVSALKKIDADIIALMEMENDGYGKHSAIAELTRALNSSLKSSQKSPSNIYQYVIPNKKDLRKGRLGHSAISVGLLYRKNTVELVGDSQVLNDKNAKKLQTTVSFNDGLNRPSLIQKFKREEQTIVIAVNHFKSKGKRCKISNKTKRIDKLQGNCNQVRTEAAIALAHFLRKKFDTRFAKKSDNILILGDLNSYSQEDPLLALYNSGYINLNSIPNSTQPSFSYSHRGYLGNLDHGLANKKLLSQVRSFTAWHINSVEDVLLDYNTEENGHKYPAIDHYGEPDEKRSSDHDPLVIGIELK